MTAKTGFQFNLPITVLREGKKFIAYTPALDLSTSGNTFKQVKKRFGEAVSIFFEETLKRGTLDQALSELGWQKIHTSASSCMRLRNGTNTSTCVNEYRWNYCGSLENI